MVAKKYRKRRILLIVLLILMIILVAIQVIVRNYINKNSESLIGRKVNIESLYINYLTGALSIHDLLLFEENQIDTFVYVEKFYVNPSIISIAYGSYTINTIEIDGLICNTIVEGDKFNFDSMIDFFSEETDTTILIEEDTSLTHWGVNTFTVSNTSISYIDKNLESNVTLENLNLNIPEGMFWDDDEIMLLSNFNMKSGGKIDTKFDVNIESGNYSMTLNTKELDLNILIPYMADFLLINDFGGLVSTDLTINGNYNNTTNIDIIGIIGAKNIFLNDTSNTKVFGIDEFICDIDSINPDKDIYKLNKIKFEVPYCYYEMTSETDNFTRMMTEEDSTMVSDSILTDTFQVQSTNIFEMVRDYVAEAMEGVKASNFNIDTFYINDITLKYVDSSMVQPFEYNISNMDLFSYNADSNTDSLLVICNMRLNETGDLNSFAIFNPQIPGDVEANMKIENMEMKDLSPMFHYYVGTPILKGKFKMNSDVLIKNQQLICNNDLFLESFTLGKKQKHKDALKLPVKTAVGMLKDKNGDISLAIPVEGDLSDPDYKVWKVVGRIFKDLIIKAASAPVKAFSVGGTEDDKSNKITLTNSLAKIDSSHFDELDKLLKTLIEDPNLKILINPYYNIEKERKDIALAYLLTEFHSSSKDSIASILAVDLSQVNDSGFINYIDTRSLPEDISLSIKEKAMKLVNDELIVENISIIIRNNIILMNSYLREKGILENQLYKVKQGERFLNKDTKINKVQYHILFENTLYDIKTLPNDTLN